ncbi:hypothetical protein IWW36_000228 [Coemansia brasiliensis]|uniref:Uncharacterized protein n=1 Tax=Coemansia brasiliensis TaxID=2650707 RepID=A0A9W8IBF4_9FUNG|nr:hypothetical protein IWW36_000228 [Coemansia brasiliensis]
MLYSINTFTRRGLCSAALLLVLFYTYAFNLVLAADGSTIINPLGITFAYNLAWVSVESSTFGVSLKASPQSTYQPDTKWSLLLRFAPDAQANITAISKGWGLGIYDYASWALLPSKKPFEPMQFTVTTSAKMDLENTVTNFAEPKTLILVPEAKPNKDSLGYTLIKNNDYTVNAGVNLAEIPKDPYGEWESLVDINSESVLDVTGDPTPSSSIQTQSSTLQESSPSPEPSSTDAPNSDSSEALKEMSTASDELSSETHVSVSIETVLPPFKFVKGDPNYDPSTDPIGTMLGAPKIGLYLVNSILGIGVIAHILGTIRRYQYRREYQLSMMQSKNGNSLA